MRFLLLWYNIQKYPGKETNVWIPPNKFVGKRANRMIIEDFENIISLLCTIAGLLYCVFKYIELPRRGYRYLIAFYLANFLSEYYWTVYELVMHTYPDVSEFAAYLGWNIAYLALLLAVFFLRSKDARRYFHPVILLPVLLNAPQFLLYIQYGGVLNNLWQVGVTTLTMVFCLQDLLYRLKNEYNVEVKLEQLPYEHIRWVNNTDIDVEKINGTSDMKRIKDLKDRPLLLFVNSWSVGMVLDRNPGLQLSEFAVN